MMFSILLIPIAFVPLMGLSWILILVLIIAAIVLVYAMRVEGIKACQSWMKVGRLFVGFPNRLRHLRHLIPESIHLGAGLET